MSAPPTTSASPSVPPPLAPERPVVWPRRTVRRLANGLQVVLVEAPTIPKVTLELVFRSGDAAAARVAPGLADIVAAMLRTGTATRSGRQIEQDLRRLGAELSTSAGSDSSFIALSGLAEFSRELLQLVADLGQNASFPAEELERERRQMIEGLRIERATPSFLAGERLRRVLFGAHPYAVVAPSEVQVQSYRREQLEAFYREHYAAGNALLFAVGDFSAPQMLEQIEEILGGWPAGRRVDPSDPPLPGHRGRQVHLVNLPGAVQAHLAVANRAITRRDPSWYPLVLANSIYGGGFHSRLVANIREQKGYTYSPRSSLHALRHHGYFSVHAPVRNDVVAASLAEIFYEMDRIRALPVSAEEMSDAQSYLSGVFSLGLATQDGLLGQLSTVYLHELPEDTLERYRETVRSVTAGEVLAAARSYFDSPNAQLVVVGDAGQIRAQAGLFGPVHEYNAQGDLV